MGIRTLALAGGAIAVVVIGLVVFVYSSLDAMVESAIEDYGSEIVGARVRVGSVKIELQEGKGTITDLRVANPAGFPSGNAVHFALITLNINIDSLASADPIVIDVVKIEEPKAIWVIDTQGKSNIGVLQENTQRYTATADGQAPVSTLAPARFLIRDFSTTAGSLTADLSALVGPELESTIAPVKLSNVGGPAGSTPGDIGASIAAAFSASVLSSVARLPIPSEFDHVLGKVIDTLKVEEATDLIKGIFRR